MADGKLVTMANQIAAFFRAYPEEQAVPAVREHIEAFWTPRMRADFAAQLREGAPGVDPLVQRAFAAENAAPQ